MAALGFRHLTEHAERGLTAHLRRSAEAIFGADALTRAARIWLYEHGYVLPGDTREPQPQRRIADKAVARFIDRVRELTRRHRGVSLERMITDLNPLLRGWAGYFGFSQGRELASLDGWTRRRLRCVVWVQWKTRDRRYQELRRLKVPERTASAAIFSPKGRGG